MISIYEIRRLLPSLALILLASTSAPGQVVSFGLPDYAELGDINKRIQGAFQEISIANDRIDASINYSNVIGDVSSGISSMGSTTLAQVISFTEDANTVAELSSAETIGQLGSSFSYLDLSQPRSTLFQLGQELSVLHGQVSSPLPLPSSKWFTAGVVSGRARSEMGTLKAKAQQGLNSLNNSLGQAYLASNMVDQVSGNVPTARAAANSMARVIADVSKSPAAVAWPILNPMLAAAIATEGDLIDFDANTLSARKQELALVIPAIENRVEDYQSFIDGIDHALSGESLSSSWTTRGADLRGGSGKFVLSFSGRHFDHPFTEIEGDFSLGTLSMTNLTFPGNGSNTTSLIRFEAERLVNDPSLGNVFTTGTHDLSMFYVGTPNIYDDPQTPDVDESDPNASADYFRVPSLGIDVNIKEGETFSVEVIGRYNSPLRVVELRPIENQTSGFITPIYSVPEPASAVMLCGCTAIATLSCRPRGGLWFEGGAA